MNETQSHIPVMLNEIIAALKPSDNKVYIDGTFGAGGYSNAILDKADCTLIAIDRDKTALDRATPLQEKYGDRLILVHGCFGDAGALAQEAGFSQVDGFVIDLGVSSMQIDQAERGFSFRFDAPLDMRMDQSADIPTAADIVNNTSEKELADIIYYYGDERHSRKVAKEIVIEREEEPITTTGRLADIVRRVVHKSPKDSMDQATRTFQALRIAVNGELEELRRALEDAENFLKTGGRLVVVSFHSLEDGLVKKFLAERSGSKGRGSRYMPEAEADPDPVFSLPSKKAIFPTKAEISANPRSRSARMRVAVRTNAPAWNISFETKRPELQRGGRA